MKPLPLKFARYRHGHNTIGGYQADEYKYAYRNGDPFAQVLSIDRYHKLYEIRYRIAATIRFRVNTGMNIAKKRRKYT